MRVSWRRGHEPGVQAVDHQDLGLASLQERQRLGEPCPSAEPVRSALSLVPSDFDEAEVARRDRVFTSFTGTTGVARRPDLRRKGMDTAWLEALGGGWPVAVASIGVLLYRCYRLWSATGCTSVRSSRMRGSTLWYGSRGERHS
jgi:hypothetical protein